MEMRNAKQHPLQHLCERNEAPSHKTCCSASGPAEWSEPLLLAGAAFDIETNLQFPHLLKGKGLNTTRVSNEATLHTAIKSDRNSFSLPVSFKKTLMFKGFSNKGPVVQCWLFT